jgi:acetyl esterase/lipase
VRHASLSYGPAHAQVADIWRPPGGDGDRPVVVLIHGGFWRQLYTKRLMHPLAAAVVAHGWVAYNIEYRRVGHFGGGGWPRTFADVAAAMEALSEVDGIDRRRIVTCGHSAGGHLALWAATSRPVPDAPPPSVTVCGAISLAGVVDLVAAARLGLGGGAVEALMGGGAEEFPERYALGSPAAQLPLGVPQYLIHGTADASVPVALSADYVERAAALGDDATFVPLPGAGHMDMIDPAGDAFRLVVDVLNGISPPPT